MTNEAYVYNELIEHHQDIVAMLRKNYGTRVLSVILVAIEFYFQRRLVRLSSEHYLDIAQLAAEDSVLVKEMMERFELVEFLDSAVQKRRDFVQRRKDSGRIGGRKSEESKNKGPGASAAKAKLNTNSIEFKKIVAPYSVSSPEVRSVLKRFYANRHIYTNSKDDLKLFKTFWVNEVVKKKKEINHDGLIHVRGTFLHRDIWKSPEELLPEDVKMSDCIQVRCPVGEQHISRWKTKEEIKEMDKIGMEYEVVEGDGENEDGLA